MASLEKVSRAQFFESEHESEQSASSDSEGAYTTAFEIEIADVVIDEDEQQHHTTHNDQPLPDQEMTENNAEPEEEKKVEYFPLFSVGPAITTTTTRSSTESQDGGANGGTSIQALVRVNLKDEDNDEDNEDDFDRMIKAQKRPDSYYFANYNDLEKKQFEQVAVSGEDIWRFNSEEVIQSDYKLTNLTELNARIAKQNKAIKLNKSKRSNRPGKNKRQGKIACRLRREEFKKEMVKIKEREEQRELSKLQRKKKPTRRGGKRNKKPNQQQRQQQQPPVFKTE